MIYHFDSSVLEETRLKNVEEYIPEELRKWLKEDGECIHDVHAIPKYGAVYFDTNKHEYIYYPDTDKLLVEIEKRTIEYEPVLYPNRAVETEFEGM